MVEQPVVCGMRPRNLKVVEQTPIEHMRMQIRAFVCETSPKGQHGSGDFQIVHIGSVFMTMRSTPFGNDPTNKVQTFSTFDGSNAGVFHLYDVSYRMKTKIPTFEPAEVENTSTIAPVKRETL